MYCYEALNFNLDALHTRDGQRFRPQFRRNKDEKDKLGLFSTRLGGGRAARRGM